MAVQGSINQLLHSAGTIYAGVQGYRQEGAVRQSEYERGQSDLLMQQKEQRHQQAVRAAATRRRNKEMRERAMQGMAEVMTSQLQQKEDLSKLKGQIGGMQQ